MMEKMTRVRKNLSIPIQFPIKMITLTMAMMLITLI